MRISLLCLLFLSCEGAQRTTIPSAGGALIHEGGIYSGQRVAFTQALAPGPAVACADGRKPPGSDFRGHFEVARSDGVTRRRGDSWRADANIAEWRGWCESVGAVETGDLVRLVSEAEGIGVFRFSITLRTP